jgi:sulfur carrier protein ThiS adenylyltransferase
LRQRDLVPPEALAGCDATVIGVGAIGRQVALQLAAMGVPRLRLIDPDTVEVVNLAAQGYREKDLGRPKVEATAELCGELSAGVRIEALAERFRRSGSVGDAVFCCVDSIQTRRLIFESVGLRTPFFCDGRMSAEVLRVLTATARSGRDHYPTTLFAAAEAFRGACTAKSTIYGANIAAGIMVAQLAKWLRGLAPEPDLLLNLLSAEWVVAPAGGEPRADAS